MSHWSIDSIVDCKLLNVISKCETPRETHFQNGTPITKIHVTNFPRKVAIKKILKAFGRYGLIKNYYIKRTVDVPPRCIYAFITYYNVEDARNARSAVIKIGNRKLIVSPADPWHQETPEKTLNQIKFNTNLEENTQNDENNSSNECNILTVLNEDCFMKIFSYLSLVELIKIERVSKEWRYLVQQKYKCMTEFSVAFWEVWTLHLIFKKIGRYLKKLYIANCFSDENDRLLHIVSKFCRNLEELHASELDFTNGDILFKNCKNLKILHLKGCHILHNHRLCKCYVELEEFSITDCLFTLEGFLYTCFTKRLEKLSINDFRISESRFVQALPRLENLKELCLKEVGINNENLNQIFSTLKNLKTLHISLTDDDLGLEAITKLTDLEVLKLKCHMLTNKDSLTQIAKNCLKLTTLELSLIDFLREENKKEIMDAAFNQILRLKHLENLKMNGLNVTDAPFKKCLARNENCSNLKRIECRNNKYVTEEMIYAIFRYCPEIQYVDVVDCDMISNKDFAKKLLEIIHTRGCHPNRYHLNLGYNLQWSLPCNCLKITFREEEDSCSFDFQSDDEFYDNFYFSFEDYADDSDDVLSDLEIF